MGINTPKGKAPSEQGNNKNKVKPQYLNISEEDLKKKAQLGEYRWFYTNDLKIGKDKISFQKNKNKKLCGLYFL